MAYLLLLGFLALGDKPQCISQSSQLVCGYHCVANLERAACSQTPEGLCAKTPSRVVCWDPPADVRQMLRSDPDVPRPTCVTGLRGAACGFHCVKDGGNVACADTPMGACIGTFGKVACWDPSPEVRWRMLAGDGVENAQCVSTLKEVACGYHCTTHGFAVACSGSPEG